MEQPYGFDDALDHALTLDAGGQAFFGRDVLQGLVDGVLEVSRGTGPVSINMSRSVYGPVVLGCAMAMDDPELMEALEEVASACVVITKQQRSRHAQPKWARLEEFSRSHDRGLLAWAFPELEGLAPHVNGRPRVVGPYDPDWRRHMDVGGVREVGFRRSGDHLVPIVHAKLLLLGDVWSVEQDADDYRLVEARFVPTRLWLGSANFTAASRRSLEVGLWTDDPDLMGVARQFLVGLIARSEPLGSGPDHPWPEFLPVDYDHDAFVEADLDQRSDHADE